MNIYRLTADLLHLFSVLYLLTKLIKTKSCGGISGKTQLLFMAVYICRYLDLFTTYMSAYQIAFKLTYISCSCIIVILIFAVYRKSYRLTEDAFLTELLLVPCFMAAVWLSRANRDMPALEVLWTFSIYLESVAIIPQFYMIFKKGEVESNLLYYLIPLGLYRLFYIFNWIFRYNEQHVYDLIADSAGVIYVTLYILAVMLFCIAKVKVVREGDQSQNFLRENIFFIGSNQHNSELVYDEKKVADQPLLVEKV